MAVARNGCSMDYHGNHYFTDVKINVLHQEMSDVSYVIELNHMLHKNLLIQANNAICSHVK